MRRLKISFKVGWMTLLALWLGPALAQDCPERFRIAFQDGSKACLTDFPISSESPAGRLGALSSIVPATGFYAVAAARGDGQCRRALGIGLTSGGVQSLVAQVEASPTRQRDALRTCGSRAVADTGSCACVTILVDGRSPLTPDAFRAIAAPAVGGAPVRIEAAATSAEKVAVDVPPARQAGAERIAAGPGLAAPPAHAPAASMPATPAGVRSEATSGTGAELAALRQQIDELRTQMARSVAERGAPETAVRPRLRARALVIGNSTYASMGVLTNPRRDAQAMAAKFRTFGIDVDLVLDADRPALVKALASYQERAAGYDVNLLFYAGHGLQVGGINYIVPVDLQAAGATVGTIRLNAVSLNDALEYLPSSTRVVFLDACRDNPLARSLVATRAVHGAGLAPMTTVSGTLVAYATKDGATAEDGSGRNSPYTTALLQHLDAPEDIAVVLRRVRESVLKSTGQRQEPWEYGSLIGDRLVVSRMSRQP